MSTPSSVLHDGSPFESAFVILEAEYGVECLNARLARHIAVSCNASMHWSSDCHHLFLSLDGAVQGKVQLEPALGGSRREIGELFFLPAGASLQFTGERMGSTRTVALRFSNDRLDELTGATTGWNAVPDARCFDIHHVELRSTMFRVARELVVPGLASGSFIQGLAMTAGADIVRYFGGGERGRDEPLAKWRLRRIVEYLEESGAPTPSLENLASLCGVSAAHLSRAFRRATGMTIHRCIEDARVRSAQNLLANTDLRLKEVAYRLGFSGASSFTVAFKRATGEAPIAYRRRMRGMP